MVVRNGVESKRMTSGDFDLTSVSSIRVLLPCRPWGEMRLEMMNAAYGMMTQQELHKVKDAPYEEVIQNEQLNMMFNIQRSQVRLTAHASGDIVYGKKLNARIPVLADRDEVEEVLSAFFANGCSGLSQEYAQYYSSVFASWKKQK